MVELEPDWRLSSAARAGAPSMSQTGTISDL